MTYSSNPSGRAKAKVSKLKRAPHFPLSPCKKAIRMYTEVVALRWYKDGLDLDECGQQLESFNRLQHSSHLPKWSHKLQESPRMLPAWLATSNLAARRSGARTNAIVTRSHTSVRRRRRSCTFRCSCVPQSSCLHSLTLTINFNRKHKCPYPGCDKATLQKNNIDVHYKTHFGIRDWDCQFCDQDFTDASSLIRHEKSEHGYYRVRDETRTRVKPKKTTLPGQEISPKHPTSPSTFSSPSPPSSSSTPSVTYSPPAPHGYDEPVSSPRLPSHHQPTYSMPSMLPQMRTHADRYTQSLQTPCRSVSSSLHLSAGAPIAGPSRFGALPPVGQSSQSSFGLSRHRSPTFTEAYSPALDDWVFLTPSPNPPYPGFDDAFASGDVPSVYRLDLD